MTLVEESSLLQSWIQVLYSTVYNKNTTITFMASYRMPGLFCGDINVYLSARIWYNKLHNITQRSKKMTEIIVYRNPAEAALWQMLSGGAKGSAMTPTETATILRQFNAEVSGGL